MFVIEIQRLLRGQTISRQEMMEHAELNEQYPVQGLAID